MFTSENALHFTILLVKFSNKRRETHEKGMSVVKFSFVKPKARIRNAEKEMSSMKPGNF